jgi:hypothetical protein
VQVDNAAGGNLLQNDMPYRTPLATIKRISSDTSLTEEHLWKRMTVRPKEPKHEQYFAPSVVQIHRRCPVSDDAQNRRFSVPPTPSPISFVVGDIKYGGRKKTREP